MKQRRTNMASNNICFRFEKKFLIHNSIPSVFLNDLSTSKPILSVNLKSDEVYHIQFPPTTENFGASAHYS